MLVFKRCQACTLWTFCIAFRIISQWKNVKTRKSWNVIILGRLFFGNLTRLVGTLHISTLLRTFKINISTAMGQSTKKRHRLLWYSHLATLSPASSPWNKGFDSPGVLNYHSPSRDSKQWSFTLNVAPEKKKRRVTMCEAVCCRQFLGVKVYVLLGGGKFPG